MASAILLFPSKVAASAANIYLAQNATGAANGADCADAFPYTFFNSSGNWGNASNQIGPGTTVHICGTWSGGANQQWLVAQGSGTNGNPVTIKFETNAIIRASYFSTSGGIVLNNRSFITIDGGTNGEIQATLNGSSGGTCPGGPCQFQVTNGVGIMARSVSNIEIKNLTCADMYDHTLFNDNMGGGSVSCVQLQGSNLLIHDNVMHDVGVAIDYGNYGNDSNVQFYNNDISNMGWGVGCAGGAKHVTDLHIYSNHFHDLANWNSAADSTHGNGIHCFNGSGGGINAMYLYNNLFDGSQGSCCITAWVYLEAGGGQDWSGGSGTLYAWNNVIIGTLALGNAQVNVNSGSGHIFVNNYIQGAGSGSGNCMGFGNPAGSWALFENNVLQGCNQLLSGGQSGSIGTIDYNIYGNASGGNPLWQFGSTTASTLSAWRSACGCDAHSQAILGGPLANITGEGAPSPGFIGSLFGANLMNQATGNLTSLSASTSAGNTQTPVNRPAGTCTSQGQASCWTIGAYELNASAGPPPQPPTNVSASVQ